MHSLYLIILLGYLIFQVIECQFSFFKSNKTQVLEGKHSKGAADENGDYHLMLIVYESDNSFENHPVNNVLLSSLKSGFERNSVRFIGQGENLRWKTIFDETGNVPYGIKLLKVQELLRQIIIKNPNQLVLLIDGRDVFIQQSPQQFESKFKSIVQKHNASEDDSIVFSAESACCVAPLWKLPPGSMMNVNDGLLSRNFRTNDGHTADKEILKQWMKFFKQEALSAKATLTTRARNKTHTLESVYLNAGQLIGTAKTIDRALAIMNFSLIEDDQALFSEMMYFKRHGVRGLPNILLDYDQIIFSNMGWRGPKLCPFSPKEEYCTYKMVPNENSVKGTLRHEHLIFDTVTATIPAAVHTQNKFWTCYNSMVKSLLGSEAILNKVSHTQLTNGVGATFIGGYHMLPTKDKIEFQNLCIPATRIETELNNHNFEKSLIYYPDEIHKARLTNPQEAARMIFWNKYSSMLYEYANEWEPSKAEIVVQQAWNFRGRIDYIEEALYAVPQKRLDVLNFTAFVDEVIIYSDYGPRVSKLLSIESIELEDFTFADVVKLLTVKQLKNSLGPMIFIQKQMMLDMYNGLLILSTQSDKNNYADIITLGDILVSYLNYIYKHNKDISPIDSTAGETIATSNFNAVKPKAYIIGPGFCNIEHIGNILGKHPGILTPDWRQYPHFFTKRHPGKNLNASHLHQYEAAAFNSYKDMLLSSPDYLEKSLNNSNPFLLEVSSSYFSTQWRNSIAMELRQFTPDAKVVIVVCDPVDSLLKEYFHEESTYENPAFNSDTVESALDAKKTKEFVTLLRSDGINDLSSLIKKLKEVHFGSIDSHISPYHRKCSTNSCFYQKYIQGKLYTDHVTRFIDSFHHSNVLVLNSDSILRDKKFYINEILHFLDVDIEKFPIEHYQSYDWEVRRAPIDADAHKEIAGIFKAHNDKFACILKDIFPLQWNDPVTLPKNASFEEFQRLCNVIKKAHLVTEHSVNALHLH